MSDAFLLGAAAQSSVLLAGLLACWISVPPRIVGVLAMLTTSLMPFSQERGGAWAGAATVVGFCISFAGT